MTVHIAIITGQPMANLLPLLVEKPSKLILLVSEDMKTNAEDHAATIQRHPLLTDLPVELKYGLPETPIAAIQDFGLAILAELDEQHSDFVFNLAGGTKLMTLALSQVFADKQGKQIYPHTRFNKIEILWPEQQAAIELPGVIDAKAYLQTHGVTWRKAISDEEHWRHQTEARKNLTFALANGLAQAGNTTEKLIGLLNKAGAQALQGGQLQPQQQLATYSKAFYPLLEQMQQAELIDWDSDDAKTIYFKSKSALQYLTGAWLEEYYYLVAQQVGLTDSHSSVDFTDDVNRKANIRNELDGVSAHQNRLLIVECKTAKLGKNEQKDTDMIYKLSSLSKKIGGQFSASLLLSALPLDHTTQAGREVKLTERARGERIEVLAGADLRKLDKLLLNWMETGRLSL